MNLNTAMIPLAQNQPGAANEQGLSVHMLVRLGLV